MTPGTVILIGYALLLAIVAVRALLFVGRLLWPRRRRAVQAATPTMEHQIGAVISDGMERVDRLRWTGADAFQTLMPMPNGECWSVLVRRFPDEPSARVALGRAEVSA